MKPGVGLLVGLLSVATFMAAPASARVHHHHHHHHHGGGGSGPTCGPGTVNIGGTCTPSGSSGPTGNGNVTVAPSNIAMTVDGTFGATIVVSGLPPFIGIDTNSGFTCGGSTVTVVTNTGSSDALGRVGAEVYNTGPGSCVPGTYPILMTETDTPFQTFTGFITLHF